VLESQLNTFSSVKLEVDVNAGDSVEFIATKCKVQLMKSSDVDDGDRKLLSAFQSNHAMGFKAEKLFYNK
jgi:hypothetical protein